MEYANMVPGIFKARPNRFIAHVEIDGQLETVHVKNTGRCKELLQPGVGVWCQKCDNLNRKTQYDLICVQKGERLINMDSQAPNAAVGEWLRNGGFGQVSNIRAEVTYGNSRFDYTFEKEGKRYYLEVKGVTLENQGVCAFPDAPTMRGAKHVRELVTAVREGNCACVLFVIQMEQVQYLHPNDIRDPEFGAALREAAAAGVEVMAMDCCVTESSMTIRNPVAVCL